MINYKASSEAGRSVVSKLKVIDVEAVEEQVDDDGNVIVEAVAEQSHNEIKIATRTFNPDTGSKLADNITIYNTTEVEYRINDLETMISGLNEELESWKAIKSDYEALDDE